jgi:hypothetical protein
MGMICYWIFCFYFDKEIKVYKACFKDLE